MFAIMRPARVFLFVFMTFVFAFPATASRTRYSCYKKEMKSATDNLRAKRFENALSDLDKAQRLAASDAQAMWVFSTQFSVLMAKKDYEQAATIMAKAARSSLLGSKNRNLILLKQISALYHLKKYPEALGCCNKLVKSSRDTTRLSAYNQKCLIHYCLEEYDEMYDAAVTLTKYAERENDAPMCIRGKNHQLTVLLKQKKHEEALTVFSQNDYAKMSDAEKLNYLIRMGEVHRARKDFTAAIDTLEKAEGLPGLATAQREQILLSKVHAFYICREISGSACRLR